MTTTTTPCPSCRGARGRITRAAPPSPPYELWHPCGACLGTGTVEDGQARRSRMLNPAANLTAAVRYYQRAHPLAWRTIPTPPNTTL